MTLPDPSTFIAAGASAEVFRLGDGKVIKLFHAGVDEGIVHREFRIASAVYEAGLPVAQPFALRQAGGRMGIVYALLEGPTLLAHVQRHPHRGAWALSQMAQLQWRIQQCAIPDLRSRRAILIEDIEVAPMNGRLRQAAIDRLELLVEGEALSHGDLHPANLIVTQRGLAVIDWSRAACAAPATDVVRSEMLMRFGPGQSARARAGQWMEAAARDTASAIYLRRYRTVSGMAQASLAAWRPLVALAWLRQRMAGPGRDGPGRDRAFIAYLEAALRAAGLPPLNG